MAAQLSDLVVFDFLTANPDRLSGCNMTRHRNPQPGQNI